jgi:hypothetical protein
MFKKQVASEKDGHFWLKSDQEEKLKAEQVERELRYARMAPYANDLINNFNGTGHRFAKYQQFYGISYSLRTGKVW